MIRKAHRDEASQIAELFLLAWPVEQIMESNGITYEQLHGTITSVAARNDTIYSYENTVVAEVDGKIVGAMCAYDGADYQRLKQPRRPAWSGVWLCRTEGNRKGRVLS